MKRKHQIALETRHVTRSYHLGEREIRVLDNISLAVATGEFLVVEGSSGSGKTTLLSLMSGLDKPTSGSVHIFGRDITHLTEDEMAPLRNDTFGFVFQSFHLVPSLTALENVAFPAELKGDPRAMSKALHLLGRVGLELRSDNHPHQLSGGEKQRVAMCRALINDPCILFADEPTGNLDSASGGAVLHLLREFQKELGTTLVMVTHNSDITRSADRVVRLKDGRVREQPEPI